MKTKTLTNTILIALLSASTIGNIGCERQPTKPTTYLDSERRNAESLTERINKIAVYGIFNGRTMSYKQFSEITDIDQTLESDYDNLSIWINVERDVLSNMMQKLVRESEESKGYIRIDIPYSKAQEVANQLTAYQNQYFGIKPLTIEELTKEPSGY